LIPLLLKTPIFLGTSAALLGVLGVLSANSALEVVGCTNWDRGVGWKLVWNGS